MPIEPIYNQRTKKSQPLWQIVDQINQDRYERLDNAARKRLDPYRFNNDPNRAHRLKQYQPLMQQHKPVAIRQKNIQALRMQTTEIDFQPVPVEDYMKDVTLEENLKMHHRLQRHRVEMQADPPIRSTETIERSTQQIEDDFREKVSLLVHKDTPRTEIEIDMLQLAHEWGIHVYRAHMMMQQVFAAHQASKIKPKQQPAYKVDPTRKQLYNYCPSYKKKQKSNLLFISIILMVLLMEYMIIHILF